MFLRKLFIDGNYFIDVSKERFFDNFIYFIITHDFYVITL